jgi:hypothetical protein
MIKANELRIGNLVEYKITDEFDERKEWWEVSEIDADDIHWLSKVDTNDDDFRAIPLTEEWLLKFGFSTTDYKNGYIGIDHKVGGIITDFVLTYPLVIGEFQKHFIWEDSKFKYNELKYVHQLQNLYFALTNEELTTNLLTKNK